MEILHRWLGQKLRIVTAHELSEDVETLGLMVFGPIFVPDVFCVCVDWIMTESFVVHVDLISQTFPWTFFVNKNIYAPNRGPNFPSQFHEPAHRSHSNNSSQAAHYTNTSLY